VKDKGQKAGSAREHLILVLVVAIVDILVSLVDLLVSTEVGNHGKVTAAPLIFAGKGCTKGVSISSCHK